MNESWLCSCGVRVRQNPFADPDSDSLVELDGVLHECEEDFED